jgi:blue light- and temperature-responsive anti-repressor
MTTAQPLHQLLYISRNLIPEARLDAEVDQILGAAHAFNPRHGITGALLVSADTFAQVLEGPKPEVEALYRKLATDPRHADCALLSAKPVETRHFGTWSMTYAGRTDSLHYDAAVKARMPEGCGDLAEVFLGKLIDDIIGG